VAERPRAVQQRSGKAESDDRAGLLGLTRDDIRKN
jgi:hypothetical protein